MKARIPNQQPTTPNPMQVGDVFERFPLLLMFYMLPKEYVAKIGYENFPRSPYEFSQSPQWQAAYHDDLMTLLLSDAWAYMLWRHLGVKSRKESFTGYYPAWLISQCTPILQDSYLKMRGWKLTDLRRLSSTTVFTWPSLEDAEIVVQLVAKGLRRFHKFDESMEIVNSHLDIQDFQRKDNNFYRDFHRKYYHTRTRFKHIALDDTKGEHERVAEVNFDIEDVDTPDWMEHFFRQLRQDKDIEIVKLLYAGLTQEQIAKRLGYANHSGVNKRIQYIREEMRRFLAEQEKAVYHPPEPKPSTVKYDVIPFSYKRTQ